MPRARVRRGAQQGAGRRLRRRGARRRARRAAGRRRRRFPLRVQASRRRRAAPAHGRRARLRGAWVSGWSRRRSRPTRPTAACRTRRRGRATLLAAGDVAGAATILGRPHEVRGRVERGDGRGRELGFPTANVAVPERICLPADGVYAGTYVGEDGVERPAAISLGRRPTFYAESGLLLLEAHLLDFDGDLYGQGRAGPLPAAVAWAGALRVGRRADRPDGTRRRSGAGRRTGLTGPDSEAQIPRPGRLSEPGSVMEGRGSQPHRECPVVA